MLTDGPYRCRAASPEVPTEGLGTTARIAPILQLITDHDYHRFAQMLGNGGELNGERIVGRTTLELMHTNRLTPAMLPW